MEEGGGRASAEAAAASDAEYGLRTIHGREGKLNYKKEILYSGKEDGSQLTRRTHLPIFQPNTDINSEDRLCFPPLLPNTGLILIPLSFLVGSKGNGRICT